MQAIEALRVKFSEEVAIAHRDILDKEAEIFQHGGNAGKHHAYPPSFGRGISALSRSTLFSLKMDEIFSHYVNRFSLVDLR